MLVGVGHWMPGKLCNTAILNLFHGQNKQKRLDDNTDYHLRGGQKKWLGMLPVFFPPLS